MSRQRPECELKMPWGKHRGREIGEIPSGYLRWLAENCEDNRIRKAAEDEFGWRTDHGKHFEEG